MGWERLLKEAIIISMLKILWYNLNTLIVGTCGINTSSYRGLKQRLPEQLCQHKLEYLSWLR